MNQTIQPTPTRDAEEIAHLRFLQKTIGLTPAQEQRWHALARHTPPKESFEQLIARCDAYIKRPLVTPGLLRAFATRQD